MWCYKHYTYSFNLNSLNSVYTIYVFVSRSQNKSKRIAEWTQEIIGNGGTVNKSALEERWKVERGSHYSGQELKWRNDLPKALCAFILCGPPGKKLNCMEVMPTKETESHYPSSTASRRARDVAKNDIEEHTKGKYLKGIVLNI